MEKSTDVVKEITAKLGSEPLRVCLFRTPKVDGMSSTPLVMAERLLLQRKVAFRDFVPLSKLALT